ncbi:outer membrane receptor protein involved in Fe transport [Pontibacter aydingkolensis]|uniref:TonB-dependent receptor family protein n=1 Tax=Pontibacter aydingkolensis TaxID=1911536 RepID=A0ABS7CSS7_9BACT|nr:TonB-dependent receptor [Pontibacter aydingkolensis]MBW7466883.1 TonB-dependent receptor family protein [Pontibacter aydingkolensis]
MKKIILMAVAGFLAAQASIAQNVAGQPVGAGKAPVASQPMAKGEGKISGTIQDEVTKAPVEFASVALVNKGTGKIVNGSTTDSRGRFSIAEVAPGHYKLTISFVGYESMVVDNVAVEKGKDDVNVGTVILKSSTKTLSEVTITGEKPLIEDKVDRMVYNVDKDINPGATAAEVMAKVPGMSVDLEGNVQLRGSSNIRVLINNKPSAVVASNVADALKQIPADQIKAVEVITSPSAKYDAEGTAGIINIILKKDSGVQGLTGNFAANLGTINSNANMGLVYRKGKVGVSSTLGYAMADMRGKNNITSVFGPGSSISRSTQNVDANRIASSRLLQFGADYGLGKTSYIAAGIRMTIPDVEFKTTQVTTNTFKSSPDTRNTRVGSNGFEGINYDINLDYTRSFKKQGQELSVLGLISRNSRDNENFMELFQDSQLTQKEQNYNDAYNEEMTAQADYTHPISKTQTLEIGTKAIWRYAESDYRFLVASPASSPFVLQPERTDVFSYNQDVLSSYAMYGMKLEKYNLKMGLRYEHTEIDGDFITNGTTVAQEYQNLFPGFSVSRNLKENQTIKFNYSKRIQRPQLSLLNPYENVSNPKNVTRGNPDLEAELTDAYELGFSTFYKSGATINASLYLRQTNNAIQSLSTPYNGSNPDSVGRVTTTFGNIGQESFCGLSLSSSIKFLEKGRISSNVNLFYASIDGAGQQQSNSGIVYNTNLNVSYNFNKGFSAQMAGDYNSSQISLQGKVLPYGTYNFALRKEVLNKKGNVTLGVNNPFNKYVTRERVIKTYNSENILVLNQTNALSINMRQVRLSFNYQFGKQDAKARPRRVKKVSNDDAKEGEENSMQ